jgi:hypothetical protein
MLQPGDPIQAQEWLYRRSYCDPLRKYLNPDGSAHSRVFKVRPKDEGKLSVDVRSMTDYARSVGDPERFIVFEIENAAVLTLPPLETRYAPSPQGRNDAHALIQPLDLDDEVTPALLAMKSRQAQP